MSERTFFFLNAASGTLLENLVLHCCRRHKFAYKIMVVQHSTFVTLLTVTCSSTTHTESLLHFHSNYE